MNEKTAMNAKPIYTNKLAAVVYLSLFRETLSTKI